MHVKVQGQLTKIEIRGEHWIRRGGVSAARHCTVKRNLANGSAWTRHIARVLLDGHHVTCLEVAISLQSEDGKEEAPRGSCERGGVNQMLRVLVAIDNR